MAESWQSPGKVPLPLLGGAYLCWICQESTTMALDSSTWLPATNTCSVSNEAKTTHY